MQIIYKEDIRPTRDGSTVVLPSRKESVIMSLKECEVLKCSTKASYVNIASLFKDKSPESYLKM